MNMRWQEINLELNHLEKRRITLLKELQYIKNECKHPKLPKREFGKEYMDTCPDCGFIAYCY